MFYLSAYFYPASEDSNLWGLYGSNSPSYSCWASFLLTYFSLILYCSVVLSIIWFFVNCNILWSSLIYLPSVRIWICFSQINHATNIQEVFNLILVPLVFIAPTVNLGSWVLWRQAFNHEFTDEISTPFHKYKKKGNNEYFYFSLKIFWYKVIKRLILEL